MLLATRNEGKVREMRDRLASLDIELLSVDDVPIAPKVEETGKTFEENAHLKATKTARVTKLWVIAEDSGLCVDALDGAPGVRSARYAGKHGDDRANNAKLLRELSGKEERTAHYACVIALARPDGEIVATTHGRCRGSIATESRGRSGFGYDPLFIAERIKTKTLGEVGSKAKHAVSHRGAALRAFLPLLSAHLHEIAADQDA